MCHVRVLHHDTQGRDNHGNNEPGAWELKDRVKPPTLEKQDPTRFIESLS